mgnify:CR=1 FL=1
MRQHHCLDTWIVLDRKTLTNVDFEWRARVLGITWQGFEAKGRSAFCAGQMALEFSIIRCIASDLVLF